MVWKRPDNVQFPNVWRRFKGKIEIDGKLLDYTVKDISEELVEPCIDHMVRDFLVRASLSSHDGLAEDEVSVKEFKELWRSQLKYRVSLVAIVDGEGDESKRIAGLNVLYVTEKNSTTKKVTGRPLQRFLKVVYDLYENVNLFEKYGVDIYLNALGLSVSSKYKGDNVGYHLLAARDELCGALGIPLAVTCFTNPAAVNEAKKAGYEIIYETTMDKIKDPAYPRLKDSKFVLTAKAILPSI